MEIDAELAKFESPRSGVPSSFLSKEQNMFSEWVDPHQVQETEEESEPRSIRRRRKRLLRIKEASQAEPSLGQSKRRMQEILEDDDDLVPLKKPVLMLKAMKQRRLLISPVESNELPSLELPWAWEPACKDRA